jgi:release factor glutamine methyltransferase
LNSNASTPDAWNSLLQDSPLPLLEARILLEHASEKSRTWLVAHGDEPAPAGTAALYRGLTQRRSLGEPIAYLVGQREFFGLRFNVNSDVLIPRPETELLVQWAIDNAPQGAQLLELGTGSGCIAISVSHQRPDVTIVAADISLAALAVARVNAQLNQVEQAIQWVESNWYGAINNPAQFDMIISNPPYIALNDNHLQQGDLRFEPATALTDHADGMACIKKIATGAQSRLKHNGWLAFEHGFDQGRACNDLLKALGFSEVTTLQDWEHRNRICLGRRLVLANTVSTANI